MIYFSLLYHTRTFGVFNGDIKPSLPDRALFVRFEQAETNSKLRPAPHSLPGVLGELRGLRGLGLQGFKGFRV